MSAYKLSGARAVHFIILNYLLKTYHKMVFDHSLKSKIDLLAKSIYMMLLIEVLWASKKALKPNVQQY